MFEPAAPAPQALPDLLRLLAAMARRESVLAEAQGDLSVPLLEELFDAGLFTLTVPRAYGGLGVNMVDFVQAMESLGQLGPAYAMTAVPHLCISVKAVASLCPAERAAGIFTDMAAQRRLLAFAITEDTGSDLASMSSRLIKDADGQWRLRGRKQWITNLARASHIVVAARCPDLHPAPGASVWLLVERHQAGVSVSQPWHKVCANGSDTMDLYFDDVLIAPDCILGKPGQGMALFQSMVQPGRLGAAAAAVGLVRAALTSTLDATPEVLSPRRRKALADALDALSAGLALAAALGDAGHGEFAEVTSFMKNHSGAVAQDVLAELELGVCALAAGSGAPPRFSAALLRARASLGLIRLLKGPGEILSQQAVLTWLAKVRYLPAELPRPPHASLALCQRLAVAAFVRSGERAGQASPRLIEDLGQLAARALLVLATRQRGSAGARLWAWRHWREFIHSSRSGDEDDDILSALDTLYRHPSWMAVDLPSLEEIYS